MELKRAIMHLLNSLFMNPKHCRVFQMDGWCVDNLMGRTKTGICAEWMTLWHWLTNYIEENEKHNKWRWKWSWKWNFSHMEVYSKAVNTIYIDYLSLVKCYNKEFTIKIEETWQLGWDLLCWNDSVYCEQRSLSVLHLFRKHAVII